VYWADYLSKSYGIIYWLIISSGFIVVALGSFMLFILFCIFKKNRFTACLGVARVILPVTGLVIIITGILGMGVTIGSITLNSGCKLTRNFLTTSEDAVV
jgi:hypothetical protein